MRLFATCRQVSEALASGAFDDAPPLRRLWMTSHLLICDSCRAFLAQLRHIGAAAKMAAARKLDPAQLDIFKADLVSRLTR